MCARKSSVFLVYFLPVSLFLTGMMANNITLVNDAAYQLLVIFSLICLASFIILVILTWRFQIAAVRIISVVMLVISLDQMADILFRRLPALF